MMLPLSANQVGRVGIEPTRPCGQRILSPRRLPFRHRPVSGIISHQRWARCFRRFSQNPPRSSYTIIIRTAPCAERVCMEATLPRFEAVIEQHHDEIYVYLWRLLDGASRSEGAEEAGDLTQDTFTRAYRAYRRLRPGSNVRAWLYQIATNCAYSHLRVSRQRGAQPLIDEIDEGAAEGDLPPEEQAISRESLDDLHRLIARLPPSQKAAVVMRYLQEMDYAEIAAALGCSEDSARANVYQAVKRLRAESGVLK